jgi:hypothetical protein
MKIILAILLTPFFAYSQSMTATGNWIINVTAGATEAGSDYTQSFESLPNQTLLTHTVGGNGNSQNVALWEVQVQRTDINWDNTLSLNVRRVAGGSFQGNANINGGLSYQPLTTTPTLLYSGNGRMTDIPIQYQLTGLSVLTPAGTLSTTITYTLISL